MYKEVQRKIDQNKFEVPTTIVDNGKVINSPSKLANLFNNFVQDKTERIISNFQPSRTNAIEMLSMLIPEPESSFEIPTITIKETYDIIDNMEGTNSRDFDNLNSKILKMILHIASLWVTHINHP